MWSLVHWFFSPINHLTWLIALENFIILSHHESTSSYKKFFPCAHWKSNPGHSARNLITILTALFQLQQY
jgi:hypothetical protein